MNARVSELANVPMEVDIGGRVLKIRQLSIRDIFGYFETKIRSAKIAEAKEMAELLDEGERNSFLVEAWKSLPSGEGMTDMATDLMASVDGVSDLLWLAAKGINDGATEDEVKGLVSLGDLQKLTSVVNWITGMSGPGSEAPEKKTQEEEADGHREG